MKMILTILAYGWFVTHATLCLCFINSEPGRVIHSKSANSLLFATPVQTSLDEIFDDFSNFLQHKQEELIAQIENIDGSGARFSNDKWGIFDSSSSSNLLSGGITRVIQNGDVIEKGACSFTLLRGGRLTSERASSIQGRQQSDGVTNIKEGDTYAAAALSMVLHTRSPMVPTFRSDVRIFMVKPSNSDKTLAWFGGGSDLTPYYLFDDDIISFHSCLKGLCENYQTDEFDMIDYEKMKAQCDEYFYLPARSEHRGVGGMFFDDLPASLHTLRFVKAVTDEWMPSWFPIVRKRKDLEFNEQQKQWQLIRRGRYLEFNLLYDRGVKFGLANKNPRVEGVMVSAPPLIAWEYNHKIQPGSEEERLMNILKHPISWIKK